MKDKILYLIVGILIGAIITAACFLIFTKNSQPQMPENGERPNMEDFEEMRENGNFVRGERRGETDNSVSGDNVVSENTAE